MLLAYDTPSIPGFDVWSLFPGQKEVDMKGGAGGTGSGPSGQGTHRALARTREQVEVYHTLLSRGTFAPTGPARIILDVTEKLFR